LHVDLRPGQGYPLFVMGRVDPASETGDLMSCAKREFL
jgi:hypothetical protein